MNVNQISVKLLTLKWNYTNQTLLLLELRKFLFVFLFVKKKVLHESISRNVFQNYNLDYPKVFAHEWVDDRIGAGMKHWKPVNCKVWNDISII
jgi:hypothetical protein